MINHFNFLACSLGQRELCVCDCIKNNWFDSVFIWFCRRFLFFKNEWTFSLFSHFCTSPDFVFIILFFISEKRNRIPQFFPPVFFFCFRWSLGLWVDLFSVFFFHRSLPARDSPYHTHCTQTHALVHVVNHVGRTSCQIDSNYSTIFPGQREKKRVFFRPVFTFRCKK